MSNDPQGCLGCRCRAQATRRRIAVMAMTTGLLLASVVASLSVATGAPAAGQKVTAPGARLEKLAGGFEFTEGPAADAAGNVFFTDQPNDRILKWSVDGKLTTFMKPCGRSNGLCFDRRGNLWACADEKNELWCIDRQGKRTAVVKDYRGKLLNGPNDVWVRPDGGLYFTDPFSSAGTGSAGRRSRTASTFITWVRTASASCAWRAT